MNAPPDPALRATHDLPHPPTGLLRRGRPLAGWLIRRHWDVHLHHAERVPLTGPVVYASNHVGILDGPLLGILSPRLAHTLTKVEMFRGALGWVLDRSGQIAIDRDAVDPRAVKACLRVLREGNVVGVFPEGSRGDGELHRFHHGAAYLALVTGASVVPVTMLGTREPGGSLNSVPPRGSVIHVWYGEPFRVDPRPWPRTPEQIRDTSALLRERMLTALELAKAETGLELPGPMPAGQQEDDPDTGFVDQGAP